MISHIVAELSKAVQLRQIVRVYRDAIEVGYIGGYAIGIFGGWLEILTVDDGIRVDGINLVRLDDITKVIRDPAASFIERALKLSGRFPEQLKPLTASSLIGIMRNAAETGKTIGIFYVDGPSEVCYIGLIQKVGRATFSMLKISVDGEWEAEPVEYSMTEICRVELSTSYQEALRAVADCGGTDES